MGSTVVLVVAITLLQLGVDFRLIRDRGILRFLALSTWIATGVRLQHQTDENMRRPAAPANPDHPRR